MDRQPEVREASASFCTFQFFDCFSSRADNEPKRHSVMPGVMRETNVLYQQPHLIEPMKLRVYDDLPATPLTPELSHLSQWGRNLASRASSRASRISFKRTTTTKSLISKPLPVPEPTNDLPLRRRREFTPLQLSIYVEANRLSDLPAFDRLSFTSIGELKAPPKVLVRTQSETILRPPQKLSLETPKRTASMFETGHINLARPDTSYSIISTSRPPSEYDALHSHPVSLASIPGIAAAKSQKHDNVVAVMTPMQEEFSPVATAVSVDGTVLKFPEIKQSAPAMTNTQALVSPESQAPYPVVSQGPSASASAAKPKQPPVRPYFHTNYQTQKRISQWLQYRSHSSSNSTSTVGSVSTTASFAEHRRKRNEFYKLGQQTQHGDQVRAKVPSTIPASPPQPLNFSFTKSTTTQKPQHQRTDTESTVNTVSTSVLSSDFDQGSRRESVASMTTYTTADVKSRTGTVKSVAMPGGLRIVTYEEKEMQFSPALSADVVQIKNEDLYLEEIGGHLRSPGVGVAF